MKEDTTEIMANSPELLQIAIKNVDISLARMQIQALTDKKNSYEIELSAEANKLQDGVLNNTFSSGSLLFDYVISRYKATIWRDMHERLSYIAGQFSAFTNQKVLLAITETDFFSQDNRQELYFFQIKTDSFGVNPQKRNCYFPNKGYIYCNLNQKRIVPNFSIALGAEKSDITCSDIWDVRSYTNSERKYESILSEFRTEIFFGNKAIKKFMSVSPDIYQAIRQTFNSQIKK